MTPESVSAMEPQPPESSEISRLTGVFFEPRKAFEDIALKPRFWVPLILLTLASCVFVALMSSHIGWETIMKQGNAVAQERMQQMPPDQREKAEAMQQKMVGFAPVMAYASVILGVPILNLIIAAILLGIVRGIMSAPIRFKQVYAILWYAALPNLIQTILTAVVMFLKKPEEFNLQNPLAFNPAAFMDPMTTSKFVYNFAKSFDVFTIWVMILIGIGLQAAGGKKLSTGGAMTAVFAPWLVWILCRSALAGMFGG